MTVVDAESILTQVLNHPGLKLSFQEHLLAREAVRKLTEEARREKAEDEGAKVAAGRRDA